MNRRLLTDLHPAPNAEAVADMEVQPENYTVISLGSNFSRDIPEDCAHARARVVIAFGQKVTKDEITALALDAIASLHAFLHDRGHRLDYIPGGGAGSTPPDIAMPEEGDHRADPRD